MNGHFKLKINRMTITEIVISVMFLLIGSVSVFASSVTITSALSSKGNCYVAGQNLTITINASNTTAWANLHALVIASANTTLDYSPNTGAPDECLWGLNGTTGNPPDNTPPWNATNALLVTGGAGGASVTGYQMVVPVPASYTLSGPKTFFVSIDTTSSALELGQYYQTGHMEAYVTLNECSLDTATVTPTITPTYPAVCNTGQSYYNGLDTVCVQVILSTPTHTPTRTPTPTFTSTNTSTPTSTRTPTPTNTPSPTPTYTNTNTRTATPTPTDTPTQTSTFTDTVTLTVTDTISSNTPTNTPTYTPTRTVTPTFTNTPTNTDTSTPTPTRTPTPTNTDTTSPTFTPTATPTRTDTPTFTETQTPTPTYTYTSTRTITFTFTDTPQFTFTVTRTDTPTRTITNTFTSTWTHTETATLTFTPTWTPTWTVTFTVTDTPTVTPTFISFPYLLIIEAYNEAGEKVKLISEVMINKNVIEIETLVNGKDTKIFNPDGSQLVISIPGIWTPEQMGPGVDRVNFVWDGLNENGQTVDNGIYYVKVSVQDNYGHVQTTVMDVHLLRTEESIKVNIFNAAGELVRWIEEDNVLSKDIKLSVPDVLYIPKGGNIDINCGQGNVVEWDGKNSNGYLVTNGSYEIQIQVKTRDGYQKVASKKVTVFVEGNTDTVLYDPQNPDLYPKIYPNPKVIEGYEGEITIEWFKPAEGEVRIKIYNIAGELVKQIKANLADKSVKWNLKTESGASASSGTYVVVLDAKKATGEKEIKVKKCSIIKSGKPNQNIN
ncbi:MAG: T9SS type A sorting domain-containing protein [Candidatus Goldbacteria bacterium]|nr:T9SS type A sorting domain-containing protein [Candidatus Goldiibacteriota bacterium]